MRLKFQMKEVMNQLKMNKKLYCVEQWRIGLLEYWSFGIME